MNVESVKDFLDRRLGGAALSWGSLIRIAFVAGLSFLLLSDVFPDEHRTFEDSAFNRVAGIASDDSTRITSGRRSDIHGFQPRPDDDTFRIAWIGGSSIQSISDEYYTFIPAEVARTIPAVDGKDVSTDIYFLSGIRALDSYNALLAAVDDEPDMIVVTMNPVWLFNNTATRGWSELDAHAVELLRSDPASLGLFAPYLAPSDVVLSAASFASAPVRDRIRITSDISDGFADLSLLDRSTPNEPQEPDELDNIRAMRIPVSFWRSYRVEQDPEQSLGQRQAELLLESDFESNTINRAVIDAMGRVTADSGIPTYVYVAPVNHESLDDPLVDEAVATIEAELSTHLDAWDAPNQLLVPENLARRIEPFAFADLIHIQEPDAVSDYLAGELCEFLGSTGNECR